ncbi:unnamed protein product [Ixodes persulcatus]
MPIDCSSACNTILPQCCYPGQMLPAFYVTFTLTGTWFGVQIISNLAITYSNSIKARAFVHWPKEPAGQLVATSSLAKSPFNCIYIFAILLLALEEHGKK